MNHNNINTSTLIQTTDEETKRFLSGIFYRYGLAILNRICEIYELDSTQKDALESIFFSASDWQIQVKDSLVANTVSK